jgi:hypothetical protein
MEKTRPPLAFDGCEQGDRQREHSVRYDATQAKVPPKRNSRRRKNLITPKIRSAEESAKIARCKIEGFELMSELKPPKKNLQREGHADERIAKEGVAGDESNSWSTNIRPVAQVGTSTIA